MAKTKYNLMSLDSGNAQVKGLTDEGECVFPHSLRPLTSKEITNLQERGDEIDTSSNVFCVNGVYYSVGNKALRKGSGAALYGEARYRPDYYGILAAIAMFKAFDDSKKNVYLYGSHTPKDLIYRQDLVGAVMGNWVVSGAGKTKSFDVVAGAGFDEPVGAFRHATLGNDGKSTRGEITLRRGETLIVDVGGFTLGFSIAEDGKIDYDSSNTEVVGILDVLDNLESAIRSNFRKELKGANELKHDRLRKTLASGVYDAAGAGYLEVHEEVKQACDLLMRDILQFFETYGGTTTFHSILIAGGGGALMEKYIRTNIDHPHIYVAENNRDRMHMATVMGGMKILKILETAGKL